MRLAAILGVLVLSLASATVSCAHAPPVTGGRGASAPVDPDYPDQNCNLSNTVDCRPAAD